MDSTVSIAVGAPLYPGIPKSQQGAWRRHRLLKDKKTGNPKEKYFNVLKGKWIHGLPV
jgi:hypothetical protein